MMLRTLIEKEWKSVLLSPKFALTFAVSAALILLAVGVGIREYRAFEKQQEAARALLAEELRQKSSWISLATRAFREADPMQIFVAGVANDVGRLANVSTFQEAKLDQSIYSDDTILAIFRSLDLSFIVMAVLSLFAVLFTYDAVNGERESGTLRLIFSAAVPRGRFLTAKFAGIWLGLAVPLALPVLLGILAVVLARIPMEADHWARLGLFLGASALYFTFFIALGIAVSAVTRRPSTSFLVLLVSWVMMVLVIPRVGLIAAVHMVPVPSAAEVESRKEGFESRAWNDYRRELEEKWRLRTAEMEGLSEEEQEDYEDEHMWQWLEEDDASRRKLQDDIAAFSERLNEGLRNKKAEQERLAFSLSRVSPASAYRLVAMNLAGTNVGLKSRYEDAMRDYRQTFTEFVNKGSDGGNVQVRSRRSGRGGHRMVIGGAKDTLDLSAMPRFVAPRLGFAEAAAETPQDLGLLGVESLLCFVVGFVGFLRYDVR